LEAESVNLHSQLRHFAAVRLQRWYRGLYWRRWILPQQLLRMRVLLYSCMTIQAAWRQTLQRWHHSHQNGNIFIGCSESESQSPMRPMHVSGDARLQSRCTEYVGVRNAVGEPGVAQPPLDSEPLGKLVALWSGYKVRRAFASRNVQGKIQLRHDLYLLISDVEGRSHACPKSPMPQRLAPWVDVLYSGLSRLQNEVFSEVDVLISGEQSLWSNPRCSVIWRGWTRDLMRLPSLGFQQHCSPSLCSEHSLLATTAYQMCTPPLSPETITPEGKLAIETCAPVLFDEWLREQPSASSACSPNTQLTTPSPSLSLTSESPRIHKKTYMPPSAQDWKKVKPRVHCWSSQHYVTSNTRHNTNNHHQGSSQGLRPSSSAPGFFDVRQRSNDSLAHYDSDGGSVASPPDDWKATIATSSCSDPHSPYYNTDTCSSNPSPFMLKVAAVAGCGVDNCDSAWEWPILSGPVASEASTGFSRVRPGDMGSDPDD